MKVDIGKLTLSPTDLANHLACSHLTQLNRQAVYKEIAKPTWHDPAQEILQQRGKEQQSNL